MQFLILLALVGGSGAVITLLLSTAVFGFALPAFLMWLGSMGVTWQDAGNLFFWGVCATFVGFVLFLIVKAIQKEVGSEDR